MNIWNKKISFRSVYDIHPQMSTIILMKTRSKVLYWWILLTLSSIDRKKNVLEYRWLQLEINDIVSYTAIKWSRKNDHAHIFPCFLSFSFSIVRIISVCVLSFFFFFFFFSFVRKSLLYWIDNRMISVCKSSSEQLLLLWNYTILHHEDMSNELYSFISLWFLISFFLHVQQCCCQQHSIL